MPCDARTATIPDVTVSPSPNKISSSAFSSPLNLKHEFFLTPSLIVTSLFS